MMDSNVKELMKQVILFHRHIVVNIGENSWENSELKRVVELNGGKLKPSNYYPGTWELTEG